MSGSTDDKAPHGAPPQSHEHTDGPGMTGGVPDGIGDGEASGSPSSDRKQTESAGSEAGGPDDGAAGPGHGR